MLTENARAREEAERRIAAANRRMDHLERARREEEAPLLERAYQTKVPHPPPSGLHARASVLSLIPRLLGCSCLARGGCCRSPAHAIQSHHTAGHNHQKATSWWILPLSRRCRYTGRGSRVCAAADSSLFTVLGRVVEGSAGLPLIKHRVRLLLPQPEGDLS